ncbi:helix-turn-helix domain-containing protein [Rahnella bonaserana]
MKVENIDNTRNCKGVLEKPYSHILNMMACFEKGAPLADVKNKQIFNFNEDGKKQILILHQGSIALCRKRDNMVLFTEKQPFIFGLSQQMSVPEYLYLRTEEDSRICRLPLAEAQAMIEEHCLWESLAKHLIYMVSRVHDHWAKIMLPSAYEIIRQQLLELMNESPSVRNNIAAANYITSRTFLSRSGTMRILAELRAGNYITMDKGILIKIKDLPQRY